MKTSNRPLSTPLHAATRVRASILTPAIANLSRSIFDSTDEHELYVMGIIFLSLINEMNLP